MSGAQQVSFNGSKKNKEEPSESETHVHVTQERVDPEYFPVEEAFCKDFPQALPESFTEKSTLKS